MSPRLLLKAHSNSCIHLAYSIQSSAHPQEFPIFQLMICSVSSKSAFGCWDTTLPHETRQSELATCTPSRLSWLWIHTDSFSFAKSPNHAELISCGSCRPSGNQHRSSQSASPSFIQKLPRRDLYHYRLLDSQYISCHFWVSWHVLRLKISLIVATRFLYCLASEPVLVLGYWQPRLEKQAKRITEMRSFLILQNLS